MKSTQVLQCTCKHDYQDQKYGKQRRLANLTSQSKTTSTKIFRCTVCKTELNGKV